MAMTPALRSLAERADSRFSAPRSLKDAVNCWFSNLSQTLQPRMAESVRLKSQSVSMMAPARRRRAASISASVTGAALAASEAAGARRWGMAPTRGQLGCDVDHNLGDHGIPVAEELS